MLVLTNSRPKEATELLDAGVVKANNITRTVFNQTYGFACCSARQYVQRRIVDSDRVSFFATIHSSAEGSGIHSFGCKKAGFLGTVRLSVLIRSFFLISDQHVLRL